MNIVGFILMTIGCISIIIDLGLAEGIAHLIGSLIAGTTVWLLIAALLYGVLGPFDERDSRDD